MTRSSRLVTLGLSLLLCAPLLAYAPGSPENYMESGHESFTAGYFSGAATSFRQATLLQPANAEAHFMLAASLAKGGRWDEARTAFAQATALRPSLQVNADAWLASAPGAARPAVTAPPAATPPATPAPARAPAPAPAPATTAPAPVASAMRQFAVGERVEVMYREGFWVPGVVTSSDPGPCPYYNVRADAHGDGRTSNLGYFCKSVRAPTGVAAPVAACGGSNRNCPPTSAPPTGDYVCNEQVWQGPRANPQYRPRYHGTITLMAGGRYRHFDDGAVGNYRYDPATHAIAWTGGDLAGRGAVATYGLDGNSPEISIEFPTAHSRSTGNAPPRWECGLQR